MYMLLLGPGSSVALRCTWSSGRLFLLHWSALALIGSCLTTCTAFGILCWAGGSSWGMPKCTVSAGVLLLLLWFGWLLLLASLWVSLANGMEGLELPSPMASISPLIARWVLQTCNILAVISLIGRESSFFTNFWSFDHWGLWLVLDISLFLLIRRKIASICWCPQSLDQLVWCFTRLDMGLFELVDSVSDGDFMIHHRL